jgi:DNA-binding MarR family transcriptional regulator
MELDKLVDRQSQSRDKRIKLVQITQKGRSLFEEILPIAMSQYDKILSGFSRDEIDNLMGFLGRIRRNLGSNA